MIKELYIANYRQSFNDNLEWWNAQERKTVKKEQAHGEWQKWYNVNKDKGQKTK